MKRTSGNANSGRKKTTGHKSTVDIESVNNLQFQDDWDDEYDTENDDKIEDDESKLPPMQIWRPQEPIDPDDAWEFDNSAYLMFHRAHLEWPCLSFDILLDGIGAQRSSFPHTLYLALGSQTDMNNPNSVTFLKVFNINKTCHDSEDVIIADDVDLESEDCSFESVSFSHPDTVLRLMSSRLHPHLIATWSQSGSVFVWDASSFISSLDSSSFKPPSHLRPIYEFSGHGAPGFAIDWSLSHPYLLSGGDDSRIFLSVTTDADFQTSSAFVGHTDSIQDIQWSPASANTFASCSVDRTIRLWDSRSQKNIDLIDSAHDSDINALSWCREKPYMLASGSDDGSFKLWDRRFVRRGNCVEAVGCITWHKQPITAIEWRDTYVLGVCCEDHTLTYWDMSVESDPDALMQEAHLHLNGQPLPEQLLFEHMGMNDPRDFHFHPQIPDCIIATHAEGLHIFIPELSIPEEEEHDDECITPE